MATPPEPPPDAAPQMPLSLDTDAPQPEEALRAAFRGMAIARHMSFEQAMLRPALAVAIRCTAEAHARRQREGAQ